MAKRRSLAPASLAPVRTLPLVLLVTALVAAGLLASFAARTARASVMKSEIPGAHYLAGIAARPDLNRARTRIQEGNLNGAAEALKAAVAKDSLSGELFDQIGQLHLRRGEYRRAFESFQHAAVLAPEQAPVWNRLAQVALIQLGLEPEGLLALRYCQTADSTFTSAFYTQFIYHWARCEFAEAADAIAQARRHETEESHSLIWYSSQLAFELTRGDFKSSAYALRIYLHQAENDFTARMSLAEAYRGLGQPADARDQLYELLKVDPMQPGWLVEQGLAFRALGKRDSALVYFDRALRADTSAYDAGYNRALELLARRDTTKALAQLRQLRLEHPDNWLTPLLASRIARAEGDSARADLAFDEARRLNPAVGLASAMRAGAADPVPGWSSPELEDAERLVEEGEFSLAGNRLYQAGRRSESRAPALYWLSRVTRITGSSLGLPVLSAEAGAEASGGDPVYVRALAEAQYAAGDTARAKANLSALRHGSPDDIIAAALLAQIDLESGEIVHARTIFNQIAQQPTRSYRVESTRAAVLTAAHDAGAEIARQRAAAVDYLGP